MAGSVIPKQHRRDAVGLRKNLRKLASQKLGKKSSPTFGSVILTDLTALRLVWADAAKRLVSKDLVDLVAGTANQVTVADDGDGSVTLSTPQDIHTGAEPTFLGVNITAQTPLPAPVVLGEFIILDDDDRLYIGREV